MKFKTILFSENAGKSSVMIALLGAALSLSSCKTDVQQPEVIAALSITNASTTIPSLDFVIEGTRVNNTAFLYGQKIDYVGVYPGTASASVYATASTKAAFTGSFTLTPRLYHSLYIVNDKESVSYVFVKDEYKETVTDKAQVRFANLSSDSPSYSLELEGDTTAFADRAFKTLTPYKYIKPAIFKVLLKNKATNAVVATMNNVDLKAGKYYTIWAKGLATTTVDANKLGIHISEQIRN
jgi:hypothetical protein